jgi:hypothetical protein
MRILGFCDYFAQPSSGGAERVALEVYRRLAAEGATIRVVMTVFKSGSSRRSNWQSRWASRPRSPRCSS